MNRSLVLAVGILLVAVGVVGIGLDYSRRSASSEDFNARMARYSLNSPESMSAILSRPRDTYEKAWTCGGFVAFGLMMVAVAIIDRPQSAQAAVGLP